jgi:hypothetical protein
MKVQRLPTTWALLLTRMVLVWVGSRLHSPLLLMLVAMTKAASLSTEAATATEASARTPAVEALAMRPCLLAFLAKAPPLQASLRPRQVIRQPPQASAVLALVPPPRLLVRPARSIRLPLLVCLPPRQATTRQPPRVTLPPLLATRPPLHRSLRHRPRTAPPRPRILEPHRHTTALRLHASARRHRSTVRQARNSTPRASDVLLLRRRRPHLAQRARHTPRPVLLETRSTRQRRLVTPLPLRARRHTLVIRGGRRPARRTRLRKSLPVIVVPSLLCLCSH